MKYGLVLFLGFWGCGSSALQSTDASNVDDTESPQVDVSQEKTESMDLGVVITEPVQVQMSVNQYIDSLCFDAEVCLQVSPGQTCMFNVMSALVQNGPIVGLVKRNYDDCMAQVEVQGGKVNCDTFDVNHPPEVCTQAFVY